MKALKALIPIAILCPTPPKKGVQRPYQPPHISPVGAPTPCPHTALGTDPQPSQRSPSCAARLSMAGAAGQQQILAAVPRDCSQLPGASQLHPPLSQRRGYRAELLKGSHPTGRVSYSLRAEPGAGGLDGLFYPLPAVLDEFCEESWSTKAD